VSAAAHERVGAPAGQVRVRLARAGHPADVAAVAGVARAAWPVAYRDILPPSVVESHLDRAYARAAIEARVASTGIVLLAEADGRCVGFCHASRRETRASDADLWAIYVDPPAQGRGVGTALLQAARAALPGARLHVALAAQNEAAARFYARRGFVAQGSGYWGELVGHPVRMRSMVLAAAGRR